MTKLKSIYLVIGNLGVTMCLISLNTYLVPYLGNYLNIKQCGMIFSLFWIIGSIVQPFSGIISDGATTRWGRRKPFVVIFSILCCIFGILFSVSNNFAGMIMFMMIFFILYHFYQVPLNAMIPDNTPKNEKGVISGYWNFFGGMGSIIVPVIGALTWYYNNRFIFIVVSVVILFSSIVPVIFVQEKNNIKAVKFTAWTLKEYFRSDIIKRFYFAKVFWWFAFACEMPYLTVYFNRGLHQSMSLASTYVTVFMLFNIAVSPLIGRLSDKYNKKIILIVIMILYTCINILIPKVSGVFLLIILMGLLGICYSSIIVVTFAVLVDIVKRGHEGLYLGIDNVFTYLPQAFATTICSLLITHFGYNVIFLSSSLAILASCCIIALLWRN